MSSDKHVFGRMAQLLSDSSPGWSKQKSQAPKADRSETGGALGSSFSAQKNIGGRHADRGSGAGAITPANRLGGALITLASKKQQMRFENPEGELDLPQTNQFLVQSTSRATK